MEQASELFRRNEDHELLSGLRAAGLEGEVQHAEQLTVQFAEHQEQLEEVGLALALPSVVHFLLLRFLSAVRPFLMQSLYTC